MVDQREVIVFVGLQASGKSSFYRQRFAASHVLVSKDLFPSARNKEARQWREIALALASGRDVVVDNTNASSAERALVMAQARASGARVVGYYFASKVADCLRRNALRKGDARVPDVGLLGTAKRLERPAPAEGFAELWFVQLDEEKGFTVEPWKEDA
jgi:predicted kinase